MELRFNDCRIREWRPADAAALVKLADNYKVWVNLDDRFPRPYTLSDAREWIGKCRRGAEQGYAIVSGGEVVGGIGLDDMADIHRRTVEIGYWLGEPFWGKGIATGAVKALTRWAFRRLDIVRIQARVFESNRASARVLEKAGFELEGCLRRHVTKNGWTLDLLIYGKIKAQA
jgi:[ribosomal protein S5]-alanine N-acetyltransferase